MTAQSTVSRWELYVGNYHPYVHSAALAEWYDRK
jgi:hypothetical protein